MWPISWRPLLTRAVSAPPSDRRHPPFFSLLRRQGGLTWQRHSDPTPITLTLTDRAAAEVRSSWPRRRSPPETAGLRVGVLPGGCSGFKYSLNIEDKPEDDDIVIETGGVRLLRGQLQRAST